MKVKEVTCTLRIGIPGRQYDYEMPSGIAEVEEGEDVREVYQKLRKQLYEGTAEFKKIVNKEAHANETER